MIDYTLFYKDRFRDAQQLANLSWDRFISVFDGTDRVSTVFAAVTAATKHWLLLPEYELGPQSLPQGAVAIDSRDEAEAIAAYFTAYPLQHGDRLAVDISGFLRPHLVFMTQYLGSIGVRAFDAIYAEPLHYARKAETVFAHENIATIRQVAGYEGIHSTDLAHDVLVMAAGYEDHLVTRVAEQKAHARKVRLLGFPSLQADMYQESILRQSRSAEAVGEALETLYAPAYDPFVAASVISKRVADLTRDGRLTNLYLAPLSTKPHALGMALFYLYERRGTATSIIYPFAEAYAAQSSRGVARVWRYTIELPTP
jgi:hypothetical protein